MSEVNRRNKRAFGNLFGSVVTAGIKAPVRLGEGIGGGIAREVMRFNAKKDKKIEKDKE